MGAKHFYELTKPRLSFLSVFSALVAYGIAPKTAVASTGLGGLAYALLVAVGIALCAGGAAVLNQWLEYPLDHLMQRTKDRPIPAEKVSPKQALTFGLEFIGNGCGFTFVGEFSTDLCIGFANFGHLSADLYAFEKGGPINTLVGAIPGALPPLIGWSAAEGTISTTGWLIFAILFLADAPLYALAWLYKEDYCGWFPNASVKDPMVFWWLKKYRLHGLVGDCDFVGRGFRLCFLGLFVGVDCFESLLGYACVLLSSARKIR